ncbi:LysM peptidoglycan-binding domain-containing protein [Streptomyces sp. NBC_01244]|nr:LysM peptidoglycan-binding domain-containing protein [Streptomyces sp. NBC_01244]
MHVVRKGDTLVAIARRHRVRGGWQALYAENRTVIGARPEALRIGTMLMLPAVRSEPPVPVPVPQAPSPVPVPVPSPQAPSPGAVANPAAPALLPPGPSATPPRADPSVSPGPAGGSRA